MFDEQGALLSRFVSRITPATVTIHRKFSRPHLRRALCCRLGRWRGSMGTSVTHPIILSPSSTRKFDERLDGMPPFGSGAAFCWWEGCGEAVRLNGRSGLMLEEDQGTFQGESPDTQWWAPQRSCWLQGKQAGVSPVSKAAMLDAYEELCARIGVPIFPLTAGGQSLGVVSSGASPADRPPADRPPAHECIPGMDVDPIPGRGAVDDSDIMCLGPARGPPTDNGQISDMDSDASSQLTWARRYRMAKMAASQQYEADRDELLSSPLYFVPSEGSAGHPRGAKRRMSTGYRRKL